MAMGGLPIGSPVYSRLYNPTAARYEQALAQLEGADEAVAFGSGMAAVTGALMAAKQRGNHIVAVRPLDRRHGPPAGLGHAGPGGELGRGRWHHRGPRPDTAMVIVETPANPTLALLDLEDIVRQAGKVPYWWTTPSPLPSCRIPSSRAPPWSCTARRSSWVKSLALNNPNEKRPVKSVQFISGKNPIKWKQTAEGLVIDVKGNKPCEAAYAFKIEFKK